MGGEQNISTDGFAVVFPGQGAQTPGMGTPWTDHSAWALVERAEKLLDRPLAPLLIGDESVDLSRTENSQMSVLLVSLMGWEALQAEAARAPVAFGGHSLGQITALIAAGAISFDDGIRLADERARLTQRDADAVPGKMAALLGATAEQADKACRSVDGCWIANDNTVGQIVIAGTPEGVLAGSEAARNSGVRKVMPLDVGGAFHTPLFAKAAADLSPTLSAVEWAPTHPPVVANTAGQIYTDGSVWSELLSEHLVQPVRWVDCMQSLSATATTWVEIGPGNTLAAFAKRSGRDISVRGLSAPSDLTALLTSLTSSKENSHD